MKDLTLVFPQWQGSIDNETIYHGALELAANIRGLPALQLVQVVPFHELGITGPIAGKKDILSHLRRACTILKTESPDRILVLGGDCSTEVGPVSWLNSTTKEDLALIWFDAHPDLNTPRTSQSGRFQGMA